MSTEYGLHTLLALLAARFSRSATLIFKEHADCAKISRTRLHYRRLLTSLATATIANTEEARQEVESLLESDSRRIYSVPFLVPPLINRMTEADLKLSPPGKRPIFLFAGRLISGKNVATLLEASSTLRQEGLVFSVVIAGDGPHLSVLVQTVHDLHLEDTVTFSGRVPYNSIGHLYARCDVFVMPSFTDYRSVAVLEAMRFGKPIIDSSGDGNAGNAVLDGVNGFVFDPADIDALACAMSHFIHRPGLIGKMGPRSAELVVDRTPASAADALRRVLIEITQRSAPGLQHDVMVPFREQK